MKALLSVYYKEGIETFAQRLVALGYELFASGGTAKFLDNQGVPVTDVATIVGEPILGHRVVTLSREVHAGLISSDSQRGELEQLGIPRFDLVYSDFYPLSEAISLPDATIESVIEATDIGGPAMVRSAAKGARIVICDPADRETVLIRLEAGSVDEQFIQKLRAKAEAVVASYCLDSARFHSKGKWDGFVGHRFLELGYGENRNQSPASLFSFGTADDPLAWDRFKLESGLPGYINIADGDRALEVMCFLAEAFCRNFRGFPFIAIACKHGNPCGAAFDWDDPHTALENALLGNSAAVMGAELMTNFPISESLSELLFRVPEHLRERVGRKRWGTIVIFAPSFSQEAMDQMGKWEGRRLLSNPALSDPQLPPNQWTYRMVRGGFIRQRAPHFVLTRDTVEQFTGEFSDADFKTLLLACTVAWRATSNTVALAREGMLIGLGAGQQDRRECAELAIKRAKEAGHSTQGSVFASDAFFPFAKKSDPYMPDEAPEMLVLAGCIGGVVPADGKNLGDVEDFFREAGMPIAFVNKNNRGFSQH